MINIMFHTYQSFKYLHIIISNNSQKIDKIFDLKGHFRQSSSIVLQLKSVVEIESKLSTQVLMPQLCIHLDQI